MKIPWQRRRGDVRTKAEHEVAEALRASLAAGEDSTKQLQRAIGAFQLLTELQGAETALGGGQQ